MIRKRMEPRVFELPKEKIRTGFYSDKYFVRTRQILNAQNLHPVVTAQVFCKKEAVVAGLDEAVAILKECTPFEELMVRALYDGDRVGAWENVMEIEGDLGHFCHLETVLLGAIARPTATATAVAKLVGITDKSILYFSPRFDHYRIQNIDGYAARIAGANAVSTDAAGEYLNEPGMGTIPHSLIAAFHGDTVKAALAFDDVIDAKVPRIVLVDWDNDCIGTSCRVVEAFAERVGSDDPSRFIGEGKGKIWGVRFDTAGELRDVSVFPESDDNRGVCTELVFKARRVFDERGWKDLKIVASGGFNADRIRLFEERGVPVDAYGVGSAIFQERIDFTMDVVRIKAGDGWEPCAKVGRQYNPNPRLHAVE